MRYNRRYHPAFAWGYWTIFACLVIMAIAAVTDVIPLALQPRFIFLLVATMVVGGAVAIMGFLKSYDKRAYPVLVAVLLITVILVVIYYLNTR